MALRLYVASQCASAGLATIVALLFGLFLTTRPQADDGHALSGPLTSGGSLTFGALIVACDVGVFAANVLTIVRPGNRTRIPSVLGVLLGLAYWPSVFILALTTRDAVVPFVVGAPRVAMLLSCLTAISVARDAGDLSEVPRLQRVVRWQGGALAFVLVAVATQGTAGASPLGFAVPSGAGLIAFGIFVVMGAPGFLRLARVVDAK